MKKLVPVITRKLMDRARFSRKFLRAMMAQLRKMISSMLYSIPKTLLSLVLKFLIFQLSC